MLERGEREQRITLITPFKFSLNFKPSHMHLKFIIHIERVQILREKIGREIERE